MGARSIDSSRSFSVPGIVFDRGSAAASWRIWATRCSATQPVMPDPSLTPSCSGVSSTYSPPWPPLRRGRLHRLELVGRPVGGLVGVEVEAADRLSIGPVVEGGHAERVKALL